MISSPIYAEVVRLFTTIITYYRRRCKAGLQPTFVNTRAFGVDETDTAMTD
jgi:hypothetical protein